MTRHPMPGDYFVTSDGPQQPSLRGSLYANIIQWVTDSPYNHAGICLSGASVVEAAPGGVRIAPIEPYLGSNTLWSTGLPLPGCPYPLDPFRASMVRDAAVSVLRTPYGWTDVLVIGLAQKKAGSWNRLHPGPLAGQPWWVRRLARTDRFICSQLVDWAFLQAGVHLFSDGRASQFCSPGDLGRLLTPEPMDHVID